MAELFVTCHSCGTRAAFDGIVPRAAHCDRCGMDLRCCRSCRFYDTSAYNDCAEPSAERVVDKDRANFCDYFTPRAGDAAPAGASPSQDAQSALEQLFRKG